jgi:hypothetical protein
LESPVEFVESLALKNFCFFWTGEWTIIAGWSYSFFAEEVVVNLIKRKEINKREIFKINVITKRRKRRIVNVKNMKLKKFNFRIFFKMKPKRKFTQQNF